MLAEQVEDAAVYLRERETKSVEHPIDGKLVDVKFEFSSFKMTKLEGAGAAARRGSYQVFSYPRCGEAGVIGGMHPD